MCIEHKTQLKLKKGITSWSWCSSQPIEIKQHWVGHACQFINTITVGGADIRDEYARETWAKVQKQTVVKINYRYMSFIFMGQEPLAVQKFHIVFEDNILQYLCI